MNTMKNLRSPACFMEKTLFPGMYRHHQEVVTGLVTSRIPLRGNQRFPVIKASELVSELSDPET
jgi:hypothetical protein